MVIENKNKLGNFQEALVTYDYISIYVGMCVQYIYVYTSLYICIRIFITIHMYMYIHQLAIEWANTEHGIMKEFSVIIHLLSLKNLGTK